MALSEALPRSYGPAMGSNDEVMALLRREIEWLRAQYVASGRGAEFDRYVAELKAAGHYPFED